MHTILVLYGKQYTQKGEEQGLQRGWIYSKYIQLYLVVSALNPKSATDNVAKEAARKWPVSKTGSASANREQSRYAPSQWKMSLHDMNTMR